ncbi:MAG: ATP-binding protein [Candidatus Hermodarchaeota archaeon]
MTNSKHQRYKAKFDKIIIKVPFLGKLITSLFGLIEFNLLEFFRYLDKIFQIKTLNFVNRYIFRGRWGGRIIPLNKNLDTQVQFLPSQEILELINRSNVTGIAACYCRETQRKHESKPNCDHPINTCIHLGYGKFLYEIPFKSENLKEISKQKIKELLELWDKRGLVHQIIYFPNPYFYYVICNCCPCCCFILSKFLKLGSPQIIKADFVAKTNHKLCRNCGICENWCYFGARKLKNYELKFNPKHCFGCGMCIGKCPEQAILLKKKVAK